METATPISLKAQSNMEDDPSFFIVEDVLPVAIRKAGPHPTAQKAMIQTAVYADKGLVRPDQKFPEENFQLHIWKKLIDIDQKLNFLLEKLVVKPEDDQDVQQCSVWLSETGIRLITTEDLKIDEAVEVRLLVPLQPIAWLILYGIVSRVDSPDSRSRDVTIVFSNMDDDIRQMIRYYLLNRQREMIRRLKNSESSQSSKIPNTK
ncbi:MAG: PilZ domain-containing protein [Desulfatirhabdiaceae bacterium]